MSKLPKKEAPVDDLPNHMVVLVAGAVSFNITLFAAYLVLLTCPRNFGPIEA
jgi:hypothetical protein